MTSQLATDAFVPKPTTKRYYLETTKEGTPINKQVARTVQIYSGVGGIGVTIDYDGSDDFIINGVDLTGPLIIRFGPSSRLIRNRIGRELKIHILTGTTQPISLSASPAFIAINGTALQQLTHIIAGDSIQRTLTLSFTNTSTWNLDYGAANSVLTIPTLMPRPVSIVSNYLAPVTVNTSSIVTGGVSPFTATVPGIYAIIYNPSGSFTIDNTLGTVTYYPESRSLNFPPTYSVPVIVTDAVGSQVVSELVLSPNIYSNLGGVTQVSSPVATYIGTSGGVHGVYTKGAGATNSLVYTQASTILTIAGDQNDNLLFFTDTTTPLAFKVYDPVTGALPFSYLPVAPTLSSIGITNIRCMSYDHDTDRLFIFGNTVTEPVHAMKMGGFQRVDSDSPPLIDVQYTATFVDLINPNTQTALSNVYADTSYVTGCEFVDGGNLVVIAVWDPLAARGKIVTLNKSMFSARGTNIVSTTYDQYVVGSFNNVSYNNSRIALYSRKTPVTYYLGVIKQSKATSNINTNFTFTGNAEQVSSTINGLVGLPVEARGTRTLINF
jgi:hypothetical protein